MSILAYVTCQYDVTCNIAYICSLCYMLHITNDVYIGDAFRVHCAFQKKSQSTEKRYVLDLAKMLQYSNCHRCMYLGVYVDELSLNTARRDICRNCRTVTYKIPRYGFLNVWHFGAFETTQKFDGIPNRAQQVLLGVPHIDIPQCCVWKEKLDGRRLETGDI